MLVSFTACNVLEPDPWYLKFLGLLDPDPSSNKQKNLEKNKHKIGE
jgi:hypothetical protein